MKLTEATRKFILTIGKHLYRGREVTMSKIKREGWVTLSHLIKVTKELEDNKLIEREKIGRDKKINLTSEGWKAYHSLRILKEVGLE